MKKTMAILLSAVMMIVMLTGCIHQDMGVKMNKDGTGSITTTLGIEKDFYDQLVSMGSDPFEGKTTTEYEYDGTTYCSEPDVPDRTADLPTDGWSELGAAHRSQKDQRLPYPHHRVFGCLHALQGPGNPGKRRYVLW